MRQLLGALLLLGLVACTQPAGGVNAGSPNAPQVGGATPVPLKDPLPTPTPGMAPVGATFERLEVTIDGVPVGINNTGTYVVTKNTARWTVGRDGGGGWYVDLGVAFGRPPAADLVTVDARTVSIAINRQGGSGGWLATRSAKGESDMKVEIVEGLVTVTFDGTMSDPSAGRTAAVKATLSGRLR